MINHPMFSEVRASDHRHHLEQQAELHRLTRDDASRERDRRWLGRLWARRLRRRVAAGVGRPAPATGTAPWPATLLTLPHPSATQDHGS